MRDAYSPRAEWSNTRIISSLKKRVMYSTSASHAAVPHPRAHPVRSKMTKATRAPAGSCGVRTEVHRSWHINHFEIIAAFLALKLFLPQLRGCKLVDLLVRTGKMTVVLYLNLQGGFTLPPCRLARRVLFWAQTKLLLIIAVHVPGHLNSGEDLLSRQSLEDGEWRLHPQVVDLI